MNYKVVKESLAGKYFQVPERKSGIFNLPAPAFKIYVWLLSHENGFEFNRNFLDAGVKMHHITVTKNLKILEKCGVIKNVTSDINLKMSLLALKYVTSDIKVNNKSKSIKESKLKSKNVISDISSFESKSIVENVKSDISEKLKELEENQLV